MSGWIGVLHAFIITQSDLLQCLVLLTKPSEIVLRLAHLRDGDLKQFAHLGIARLCARVAGHDLRFRFFRVSEILLFDLELRQLAVLIGDEGRQDFFFG
jgi:hypothetical protein